MFVVKQLYNLLFAPLPTEDSSIREYNRIIDEINAFGVDDDDAANNRHVEESFMPDAVFFRYRGKIFI